MDTWGSFVIVQECVVLIIVKKSTTDCFIRLEVFCQVVTVGEWELKRRKSYHQLVGKMTVHEGSGHNEGESKYQKAQLGDTYTTVTQPSATQTSGTIALRTIPVYLKNGTRKIKVNALLDDASTKKTYINSDVAVELGLQGQLQRVIVSVLNSRIETFKTSPVECTIESLDGKSKLRITALTTKRVIGDMKAIDWSMCSQEWSHLRCLEFPKLRYSSR